VKRSIIIILGEPNSISSEIFLKSLNYIKKTKLNFIIIGNYSLLEKQANYLDFKINVKFKLSEINSLENVKFNFINVDYKQSKPFNLKTNNSDTFVKKCFEHAVILLKKKLAIGLINLPINKSKFTKNKYKGITEYIADKTNNRNKENMLLFNENFSVLPLTTHIPLKKVYKEISYKKIEKACKNINNFYLKTIKRKKFKIGILGLNPHIDVLIGHYHDQILTTFKTKFDFNAINITIGLPFIRISPDHGIGTGIIGKGIANPKSFKKAVKFFSKYNV